MYWWQHAEGVRPRLPRAPTPTRVPTPTSADFGLSRAEVYRSLRDLNIGLLPLNRHTNELFSTMLPNGDIMVDIFGPSDGVNAIETMFRLVPAVADPIDIDRVVTVMLQVALGGNWRDGERWVVKETGNLSLDRKKIQTAMDGVYLTLYLIPRMNSVVFSVDTERQ